MPVHAELPEKTIKITIINVSSAHASNHFIKFSYHIGKSKIKLLVFISKGKDRVACNYSRPKI